MTQWSAGDAGNLHSHPEHPVQLRLRGLCSERHSEDLRKTTAIQGTGHCTPHVCVTDSLGTGTEAIEEFSFVQPYLQLDSVAECASRLRVLTKALNVEDLRLDSSSSLWRQEMARLQGAVLGLDSKESLLEALGLVLKANHQLEPQQSGTIHSNPYTRPCEPKPCS